jgi:hypothetical protein
MLHIANRNSVTMPHLMDLPSELLFQIIDHVLTSPSVLPQDTKGILRYRPEWKACQRNLYCIPSSSAEFFNTPKAFNLLLVSQRMNAEIKEYIAKAPQTFKFDLAVINDHWVRLLGSSWQMQLYHGDTNSCLVLANMACRSNTQIFRHHRQRCGRHYSLLYSRRAASPD